MVTSTKVSAAERVEEQPSECRHHWVIESASGPTSDGICRLCGVRKQFKNYLENAAWGDNDPRAREPIDLVASSVSFAESEEES